MRRPRPRSVWRYTKRNLRHARRHGVRVVVLGDSNSGIFEDQRGFLMIHRGPLTMHRLGRPGELLAQVKGARVRFPVLALPRAGWRGTDVLVVSTGEIDVRVHTDLQVERQGRDADELLAELADAVVVQVADVGTRLGCAVGMLEITPPARVGTLEGEHVATVEKRARWTATLNTMLRERLEAAGHLYVPLPPEIADADGVMRDDCRDHYVHVNARFGPELAADTLRAAEEHVAGRPRVVADAPGRA